MIAMKADKYTSIGGAKRTFGVTCWIVIESIASNDNASNRAIVGDFLKGYWKPLYYYLRHKGYNSKQANGITQGFFHEVILGCPMNCVAKIVLIR